uniref:Uncharacterized protein n=1 Tax=Oryza rufipogon TaxID=4529 RepID=A0A0E0NBP2_ORYRU
MRFARFPISDGMLPVRVFMPRLSTLRPRNEQSSGGISPWNLLLYRARISRPVQLASDAGICPWKALSLRLRKMSQLYRKAKQWLSGLLSDSGITTGAYPVDAY